MTDWSTDANDGEMQWVGLGGKTAKYHGPLFELGEGVPRNVPDQGVRRAIFDACFGYVSGFPVRDIAYFVVTRSLWRQRTIPTVRVEVGD